MNLEIQVGQFLKQVGQIGVWLTNLDDSADCGASLCSSRRSTEQPFFSTYGEIPDARSQMLFVMAATSYGEE